MMWQKHLFSLLFIDRQVLSEHADGESAEAKPVTVESEPVPKSTPPLLRVQVSSCTKSIWVGY